MICEHAGLGKDDCGDLIEQNILSDTLAETAEEVAKEIETDYVFEHGKEVENQEVKTITIPYYFELKTSYLDRLEKGFSLDSNKYEDVLKILRLDNFPHPYPLVTGISHQGLI